MANNYVLFSEEITDLSAAEVQWLEQVLVEGHCGEWEYERPELPGLLGLTKEEAHDLIIRDAYWPDFEFGIDNDLKGTSLSMWSEDNGSVENVAVLYRAFLRKFRPEDVYWLEWATTCSRPLVGQFGGGMGRVSAEHIVWLNTGGRDSGVAEFIKEWREAGGEQDPMQGR
ncbi:MAG: hypothetical protein E3J64_00770 [Anaerolineales bacterium]|nr:MAG: hypothetical protein E3J64_00770 [Anaerolineales bacterium]